MAQLTEKSRGMWSLAGSRDSEPSLGSAFFWVGYILRLELPVVTEGPPAALGWHAGNSEALWKKCLFSVA